MFSFFSSWMDTESVINEHFLSPSSLFSKMSLGTGANVALWSAAAVWPLWSPVAKWWAKPQHPRCQARTESRHRQSGKEKKRQLSRSFVNKREEKESSTKLWVIFMICCFFYKLGEEVTGEERERGEKMGWDEGSVSARFSILAFKLSIFLYKHQFKKA